MASSTESSTGVSTERERLTSTPLQIPTLNGVSEVSEVRDMIRSMMTDENDAIVEDDDVLELRAYFFALVDVGLLNNVKVLLKFLCRLYVTCAPGSWWRRIIQHVVERTQEKCEAVYGCEIDLELNVD